MATLLMKKFIFPVIFLIVFFGLDLNHWQKTANKRLSVVTTSVQEFSPKEAAVKAVALLDSSAQAVIHIGKVTRVVDGDTIEFKDAANKQKYRVRLTEIDTPESDQPWGSKAKKALSKKIRRKW